MKLSDPKKYTPENIDGTLIARGEVICQYSTKDNPGINDWTDEFDNKQIYKWIRLSFDNGLTWKFQYKLNNTEVSFSFIIDESEFIDSTNSDYPKKYVYNISNEALFNEIKYKPIGIYIEDETDMVNTSTSVLAPVIFRQDSIGFYLEILVTDLFIANNVGKICIVKC